MALLGRIGVRGRLFLAFLGISGFAVAAAGAAMYAFDRASDVLRQITQERLPPALASLELSRQAERIVAAAPALLSARTQAERAATFENVTAEMTRMIGLLEQLESASDSSSQLISVRAAPLVFGFEGNLDDLNFIVEDRLLLAERRDALLTQFTSTLRVSQRLVGPGTLLIDSTLGTWISSVRGAGNNAPSGGAAVQLIETLMPLLPQRKAEVVMSAINDSFLQIAMAEEEADLEVQLVPIERSLTGLEEVVTSFPDEIKDEMGRHIAAFAAMFAGDDGLVEIRRRELESIERARQVLADNGELATQLTAAVNQLISMSKEDIRKASADALLAQEVSSAILIAVVAMSLVSSALIAWLYVDRNLVARLRALSDSMLAIAGGNLRAPLPSVQSHDEIGQMGEALTVFRDTAVEVEENNLRDVAQARARLIDALESTSEGFAFFDADDRLELSNARYRELLHGGEDIPAGTTFEQILRRSLERRAIGSADVDPELWIEERLAQHRSPGEPMVQRRGDGRWIMISERRTEGGGTVAVYSDITELKAREEELASAVAAKDGALNDFHAVLENIAYGALFLDADLRVRVANRAYREIWGIPEKLLAQTPPPGIRELIEHNRDTGLYDVGGEQWDDYVAGRIAAVRGGDVPPAELRRVDGRVLQYRCIALPDGGRMLTYFDITELKAREEALAAERQRLAEVTERLDLALAMDGIGIWDVDLDAGHVWWSPQYTVMMGHDPGDYQPSSTAWEEHLHPDGAPEIVEAVDRLLESREETLRITQHMLTGDRRDLWTEALMHVQRDDTGRPVRLTGIDVDVTEQRRKERQVEAANVEIERKNQELESLSSKLAKYLSPQVYASIFSGRQEVKIESARKKLTVFFSDIVGFTETTEKLESEELTQLLNQYLTEMSKVALEHGATIDKYVGDAIVIFFGDPESRGVKEDALACVRMAIAMQQRMRAMAGVWRDMGIEQPLRCRIGISTSYCTVGNFGSEDRMDYTIVGGGVNLAARLESAAPPGSILISYETYAMVKDEIRCEQRDQIEVKGFPYPITSYEVIDLRANLERAGPRSIHEKLPHATIDLDLEAMSAEEQREVAGLLQAAIDRLAERGAAPLQS